MVQRRFESFDAFWEATWIVASLGAVIDAMTPTEVVHLKAGGRASLPADKTGQIVQVARANMARGWLPA